MVLPQSRMPTKRKRSETDTDRGAAVPSRRGAFGALPPVAATVSRSPSCLRWRVRQRLPAKRVQESHGPVATRRHPAFFVGRRSTALTHLCRLFGARTRPNHSVRSFTHLSSWPSVDHAADSIGGSTSRRSASPYHALTRFAVGRGVIAFETTTLGPMGRLPTPIQVSHCRRDEHGMN